MEFYIQIVSFAVLCQHVLAVLQADHLCNSPEFAQESSNSLLQANVQKRVAPTQLLKDVAPLKFMHTPKSGTSFSNVIAHTPGLCPGLPDTVALDEKNFGEEYDAGFWMICPELCDSQLFTCNPPLWKHELFGGELINPYRGHLVTMVRNPRQRIASAYNDPGFDFEGDVSEPGTRYRLHDIFGNPMKHEQTIEEFTPWWSGLVTTQLTRTDWMAYTHGINLTKQDSQEAIRRLQQDFVFVGILEQWELSMCLFRTMFGGNCVSSDFMDTRPGQNGRSGEKLYDTGNVSDEFDDVVYQAALEIFKGNLLKYNVTEKGCARNCYEPAERSSFSLDKLLR